MTYKVDPAWLQPAISVEWALTSGEYTAAQLVDRAVACGVKTICYQLIPENDATMAELRSLTRAAGLRFYGWTNVPQQAIGEQALAQLLARIAASGCGGFAANVEERWQLGDGSWNGCHARFAGAFRARFPRMPACVQSTGGGFELEHMAGYDRAASGYYQARHFAWQFECYMGTNEVPKGTPLEGDFIGHNQLGFPYPCSTMVGAFDGLQLADYVQPLKDAGRTTFQWAYPSEEMTDASWSLIGKPL